MVKLVGSDRVTTPGKYYLRQFKNVPVKHVLKMYFNNAKLDSMYQYAVDNLDELLEMCKSTYVAPVEEEIEDSGECTKIKYMNKNVANKEMKRIQGYITNGYMLVRSYYCDHCSMWHLTSKQAEELEKFELNKK